MGVADLNIKEFTDSVCRKTPAPGGGAVLGILASLGASLVCMSLEFSLKKGISQRVKKKIKRLLSFLKLQKDLFLEISHKDTDAYLKKDDFKSASMVMKELADNIVKIEKKIGDTFLFLNKNLISDFYLGRKLLELSYKGAVLILRENYLFAQKNKGFIKNILSRLEKFVFDFKEIECFLKKRHGSALKSREF